MPFILPFLPGILISLAVSASLTVVSLLLFPRQQPTRQQSLLPKPPDGSFNERQAIPPLRVICGEGKVGGDLALFEVNAGTLYEIYVHAAHRIEAYVTHYLHDEAVTVSEVDPIGRVIAPAHFGAAVNIRERLGDDVQTAMLTGLWPFWTADMRGDGLAYAGYSWGAVNNEQFGSIFPQGRPLPTAVIKGALLYDPRDEYQDQDDKTTWVFSRNLALIRLFHLIHPAGARLNILDLYLPDWEHAADVCDEAVLNLAGAEEHRYWGFITWKYRGDGQDAVSIGKMIDEAGEFVVYERGDGLIGVHAGEMRLPTIRLTNDDFLSFRYDVNASPASTVLAVRGRYVDPENDYNSADAAIWGDPYSGTDETQRTATIDSTVVQSHNHIQRLQKIRFIRANAPRISATVQYDDTFASLLETRFLLIDRPDRDLNNATVEIVNGTKLNLEDMTISFDAIVIPADLYAFEPSEEGIPPPVPDKADRVALPVPTDFDIFIVLGLVAGGATGAQARAVFTPIDDTVQYQLQYEPTDLSAPPASVTSTPGQSEVRTPFLVAGTEYHFRLRTISGSAVSEWTSYITETAIADTVAPGAPTGFGISDDGIDTATLTWTHPNSANVFKTVLYRGTVDDIDDVDTVAIYTAYGGALVARSYIDASLASDTYYWWVIAFNASEVGSSPAGSLTATF